jgi:ATP-dependent DNA helicase RecG
VPVSSFSPGAEQIEARERLEALVDGALANLGAGAAPDDIEREQIDFKEEAGRRGPGGTLNVGDQHNQEAARQLANEVACMANTPGGGAIVVGVEDRSGRLLGAALDADWLRHRVYEYVGVAPAITERLVQGIRLLVLCVAQASEPVEDVSGRIRWRTGGHCTPVDRAEWWLNRQRHAGYDEMAAATQRTESNVSSGALVVARRYLASWAKERGTDAAGTDISEQSPRELLTALGVLYPDGRLSTAGALMFCASDRTYIALSVLDVEGGELLAAPRDLAGLSLLEQIALVDDRLDTLNTSLRVAADPGFAQPSVRRLPPGAVREAVLNGVVHRDWMQHDPVEVTFIEEDSALQVVSPGGFTGGVTSENVLTQRHARYPALADLCRALHLVEKQGLGVDRMYRDMVVLGHRPPMITEEPGPRVRTRLVGGPPVVPVVNLISTVRPEPRQRDVRVALIVYTLLHRPFTTASRLTGILQREIPEVEEALETAADCLTGTEPLLFRYKDVWTLTWDAVSAARRRTDYQDLHRRGVLTYVRPDINVAATIARDWLTDHDRYTSGDHANLTGLTYAGARGQLERLEQAGLLVRGLGSGRSAHFIAGPALAQPVGLSRPRRDGCASQIIRTGTIGGPVAEHPRARFRGSGLCIVSQAVSRRFGPETENGDYEREPPFVRPNFDFRR